MAQGHPGSEAVSRSTIDPDGAIAAFYNDCDPDEALAAAAKLRRFAAHDPFPDDVSPAWQTIPSTYVVCTHDQALPPVQQQRWAERCGRTVTWDTSHSPMLSRPDLVADLLIELAS